MRISTGMIHDAGVSAINRQTSDLFHQQQQLSTGRRILTPADDPVASANALVVSQGVDMTQQFTRSGGKASDTLAFAEGQLQSATDLLGSVRTLAVSAGNTTLTDADRKSIATQLRSGFDQLMDIANAKDAAGQFIFSGYMGDTQPFSGSVEGGVRYSGDDGQRYLAVSATQQAAVSQSGNDVFNRIPNGNGPMSVNYKTGNSGTALATATTVTDNAKWSSANNSGNLEVRFWIDTINAPGVTYYDLVDVSKSPPASLFTGGDSVSGGVGSTYTHVYTPGNPIDFSGLAAPYNDFGASVTISGTPAGGDAFSVKSGATQSVFDTIRNLITTLERPVGNPQDRAKLSSDVASSLTNLDQAQQVFLTTRTSIGATMARLDNLASLNGDIGIQYQQQLSSLQDVDYTKTISDLTRTQTQLQAAQQSFVKVSGLSLFDYLR